MPLIRQARFSGSGNDAALCRTLMREYAAHLNESVGGEHICLQSLEEELAGLPGGYAAPGGAILLAFDGEEAAGCVALKPLHAARAVAADERACEMKRLWVRPANQGKGLGRLLTESVLDLARERGYTALYLDTVPRTMEAAYRIYLKMGFAPVERYNQNPVLGPMDSAEIAFLRREL